MAFSQRNVLLLALLALLFVACVAASERQPLFADQSHLTASARNLPHRFQEMIQRRRLAQATGSYGSSTTSYPPAAPRYGTSTPSRYGVYGIYGR